MNRLALIFGVTGQDGFYLATYLLSLGYKVCGTSRNAAAHSTHLQTLLGQSDFTLINAVPSDFRSVLKAVSEVSPDEIYNLSGQSSVGLSYDQPVETIESIINATLNILESIRFVNREIRFYNAGSSECFGDTSAAAANEKSPFNPLSPYAVAKAGSANLVASYRASYGLMACTGLLFNHESPIRPPRFVTQKIVRAALLIRLGKLDHLKLGSIDVYRDWGWAPDYVEAMHAMLQLHEPQDIIIATGRTVSLSYFVESAFSHHNLDWKRFVQHDSSLSRPSDIVYSSADPSRARERLNWRARLSVDQVIEKMCTSAEAQHNTNSSQT